MLSDARKLSMVELENMHVIVFTHCRASAKREASYYIGINKDDYIVTPLTEPGDRIKLDITLSV